MNDSHNPTLDEILLNFAKRVESMPRGKTYGWDKEREAIDALITEGEGLLQQAINLSGNEFAMGYDDSGCFWRFYAGSRGAGSMMGQPVFCSESPEPEGALNEYIVHCSPEHLSQQMMKDTMKNEPV